MNGTWRVLAAALIASLAPAEALAANIKYHECEVRLQVLVQEAKAAKEAQDRRIQEAINRSGWRFDGKDCLIEELEKAAEELRRLRRRGVGNMDM